MDTRKDKYKLEISNANDFINETNEKVKWLNKHIWISKLTYEQWVEYVNGNLKVGDPLTIQDVIDSRLFNYYFSVGELVKLDYTVMSKEEKEKYSDLIGLHAVVTETYSNLHSFGTGSAYQHHLTFENGFKTERCGCDNEETIPTWLLIPISDDESEKYIKLYKTTEDKSKLWFYIN